MYCFRCRLQTYPARNFLVTYVRCEFFVYKYLSQKCPEKDGEAGRPNGLLTFLNIFKHIRYRSTVTFMKTPKEKRAQSQGAGPAAGLSPRGNGAPGCIPPEMMEDALLRRAGGSSFVTLIDRSVAAFESDPLGPHTDVRLAAFFSMAECVVETDREAVRNGLGRIVAAVDTVSPGSSSKALAEKVAAGIYDWAQSVDPAQRKAVDEMLGPLVLRPTAVGKRYSKILMERMAVSFVGKAPEAPEAPAGAGVASRLAELSGQGARGTRFHEPGVSVVRYVHFDRNGTAREAEEVPKEVHDQVWKGAEEKLVPRNGKPKFIVPVIVAATLALGGLAVKCFPEMRVVERFQALTADRETITEKFRAAVTLSDEIKIRSREVINRNRHEGPLSLQQIFDIYDYVSTEVKYQSDSHPFFPQPDYLTLKSKGGDCKSKGVLLASMLEAVGAETAMYAITYHNGEGHVIVGVRISMGIAGVDEKIVSAMIEKRYAKNIAARLGGKRHKPDFRRVYAPSGLGTYLILDSAVTNPLDAIPGRTADSSIIKSEIKIKTRPGISGISPEIL